jgi:hypothetical protein
MHDVHYCEVSECSIFLAYIDVLVQISCFNDISRAMWPQTSNMDDRISIFYFISNRSTALVSATLASAVSQFRLVI